MNSRGLYQIKHIANNKKMITSVVIDSLPKELIEKINQRREDTHAEACRSGWRCCGVLIPPSMETLDKIAAREQEDIDAMILRHVYRVRCG